MASNMRKIFKEAGFTIGGSFVKAAIGFIITVIITRFVSQEIYGIYTQAFTIVSVLLIIASMGIPQAYTRYIPMYIEQKKEELIPQLIRLGFLSTTLSSVFLVLVFYLLAPWIAGLFNEPQIVTTLRVLLPILPVLIWIRNMLYVFVAYKELRYSVYIHRFIRPTIRIVVLTAMFLFSYELSALITAEIVAPIIGLVVLISWYRTRLHIPVFEKHEKVNLKKEIFSYSVPLAASQMVLLALAYADIIMLGIYVDSDMVGIYKVMLDAAHMTTFIFMALALIYKPVVSGLFARGDKAEIKKIFQKLNTWGIFLNGFLLLVVVTLGKSAISLAFTDAYLIGYPAMLILTLGYVGLSSFGNVGATLEAVGKTKIILIVSVAASLLNIGLNAALIPRFGLEGGAIATAVASVSVPIIYCVAVRYYVGFFAFQKQVFAAFLSFGLIFAASVWLNTLNWELGWLLFLLLVAGLAILYFGLIIVFGGLKKGDKQFFINLVKRNRLAKQR
ncbi:flippase [Patescibacteria group bacterium]